MLSKADASKALRALFKKERIAMLPAIFTLLGTTSRMSVFRQLRELVFLIYTFHGVHPSSALRASNSIPDGIVVAINCFFFRGFRG